DLVAGQNAGVAIAGTSASSKPRPIAPTCLSDGKRNDPDTASLLIQAPAAVMLPAEASIMSATRGPPQRAGRGERRANRDIRGFAGAGECWLRRLCPHEALRVPR